MSETNPGKKTEIIQNILVFQQNDSGESKLKGIRKYGDGLFDMEIISIDDPLPPIIDDTEEYLPSDFHADIVLDFIKHPDISHDLIQRCCKKKIPVVASGKKLQISGVFAPRI